ncbi:MAG: response regulator, partial [Gammaproteobacteria bacterium]|nr:response regulator [Gammaproteobacteria bacterium]
FTMRLPRAEVLPEAAQAPEQKVVPLFRGRLRVLVADDNADAAQSLAMLLKLNGHDTRIARDGLQAVEIAREYVPDVVLLDIGMPRMNGYDACREIRRNLAGQPPLMVCVSGWGQDRERRASADAGFDRHFVKPVEYAELEALLGQ